MYDIQSLYRKSLEIRKEIVNMIYKAKTGHIGGSLSCTDILVALFYKILKPEDKFILSKGHSVEAYYAILADKGYFPKEMLDTYCQYGTVLIGHPSISVPGIEVATGSLGHGLAIGCGMALALKRDGKKGRVYVLMGDGELQEGSIWESAMFASTYELDNLIGIVDRNYLQIAGNTEKVIKLEPLSKRWESFGWEVREINGHNYEEIIECLLKLESKSKPYLIIAYTVKGKGISFIENDYKWHHGTLNEQQFRMAIQELENKLEVIK